MDDEFVFLDAEIEEDDPDAPVGILIKQGEPIKKDEPVAEPIKKDEPVEVKDEEPIEEEAFIDESELLDEADVEPVIEEAEISEEPIEDEEPEIEEAEVAEEPIEDEEPVIEEAEVAEEEIVEDEPVEEEITEEEIPEEVVAEEEPTEEEVVEDEFVEEEPAIEEVVEDTLVAVVEEPIAEEVVEDKDEDEDSDNDADDDAEDDALEGPQFNGIRYSKSFTARLILASDEIKKYYSDLKNALLSYKKVSTRISWACDSINTGRTQIVKFNVKGKALYMYTALDINTLDAKYGAKLVETKKYAATPCLIKIKSPRKAKYALELIELIAEVFNLVAGKESNEDFAPKKESFESLLEKGLIKEIAVATKDVENAPIEEAPVVEEPIVEEPVIEEPVVEEVKQPKKKAAPKKKVEEPVAEEPAKKIQTGKGMSLQDGFGVQKALNDSKFDVEEKKQAKIITNKNSVDDIWAVATINKPAKPVIKKEEPKKEEPVKKAAPKKKVEEKPIVEEKPAKKAAAPKKQEEIKKEKINNEKLDMEETKVADKKVDEQAVAEKVIIEADLSINPNPGKFVIKKTDKGNFVFKLFSFNKRVVAIGAEPYADLSSAKAGIKSVMNNAAKAPIENQTLQKYDVQKCPKWIIYKDKKGEFRLRLLASNGNIVATTNDGYTSAAGAKQGIEAIGRAAGGAFVVRNDDLW